MGEEVADDQTLFLFILNQLSILFRELFWFQFTLSLNPFLVRLFYFQLMVTIIIIKCFERTKIQGS